MKGILEAAVEGAGCFVTCAAVCLPLQFMECLELQSYSMFSFPSPQGMGAEICAVTVGKQNLTDVCWSSFPPVLVTSAGDQPCPSRSFCQFFINMSRQRSRPALYRSLRHLFVFNGASQLCIVSYYVLRTS